MKNTQRIGMVLAAALLAVRFASAEETLTVVEPLNTAESPRLSDIHGGSAPVRGPREIPLHTLPPQAHYKGDGLRPDSGNDEELQPDAGLQIDPALQTDLGPLINAAGGTHFDGMSVYDGGYIPSDNNIAVGPDRIVETVNAAYAIYDKNGTLKQSGSLRSLWTGLGGSCAANNGGDPIVQYDQAADRWIITQLGSLSSPYAQCIAVSQTPDPAGAYFLYSYSFGNYLNDYPKFGVWPTATNSAYLATYNLFQGGASFAGAEICAYDRDAMLAGAASPKGLCYTGLSGASYLPADLDGDKPPLDGTPGFFVDLYSSGGSLGIYKLTPNFSNATATLSFGSIGMSPYTGAASVPQPSTTRKLDALSDRLMYRLAYRVFDDHASMVVSHSVATGGVAGVRWYELRQTPPSTSGNFTLNQQGTFAPGDGNHRWMGSAAMDSAGDIALGYSVSGSSQYPSIRYTGRNPTDALGQMQTEASIKEGSGSQTGYSRWGDYSSLRIDPEDDCTFWYVNEYLPTTSSYGWYTHIGSFAFDGCGAPPPPLDPDFSLSANPTSLSLTQGDQGGSTITVTSLNGFNSSVGLTVSGCPGSATCSLTPGSATPSANGSETSTLSVTNTSGTPTGSYTLTVTGTSGGKTHSTTVLLSVQAPAADFTMPSPLSLTVNRKSSSSVAVPIGKVNGSDTSVTLSISGLPTQTSGSFSPNPVSSGSSSTLTVKANNRARTGIYSATITGSNGSNTHTTGLTLTIQ